MQTIPLYTSTPTPMSTADNNYDSGQKLNINDKFINGDVDQQLVYVNIYKHYWDLMEQILAEQNEEKLLLSHKIVTPVAPVIEILCVAVWYCYVQLSFYGL